MSKIKNYYDCSLELTIHLIGGKWKLIILWHLIDGTKRFSELKKALPSITQKMLTQQLRELQSHNIICRKVYAVVPPKVEYSLSPYGHTLIPILKSLCKWSRDYATQNNIEISPPDIMLD